MTEYMPIINISEKQLNEAIRRTIIKEEFDQDDMLDIVKKNREFEKRVKEIAAGVVSELFRILWQRKAFYDDIKK